MTNLRFFFGPSEDESLDVGVMDPLFFCNLLLTLSFANVGVLDLLSDSLSLLFLTFVFTGTFNFFPF